MDSTSLYGYVPLSWISIFFAVSYLLSISTTIPICFKNYKNYTLGTFLTLAMLFQLTGHISMSVSSFQPHNISAWKSHLISFTLGKIATRLTVYYVYYTAFRRMTAVSNQKDNHRNWHHILLNYSAQLFGVASILDLVYLGKTLASPVGQPQSPLPLISSILILIATVNLILLLGDIIYETKSDIPWYKLTWMSGHYWALQLVPLLLSVQDIAAVVIAAKGGRTVELVVFGTNLGITKSVLILLGGQTYEMAVTLSKERPGFIKKLEELYNAYKEIKQSELY